MRDDTQLTQEERYQIEALLKVGHPQSEIAVVLKRHKSTISREFRRNRGLRGYRPKQVQRSPPHPTTNKHQNNAEGHRFRLPVHHQYSILPHEGKVRTCSQQVLQELLAIGQHFGVDAAKGVVYYSCVDS